MKIVFAGTPQFAVPCLQSIYAAKHQVLAVYTQPDRPAGRGRKLQASPVKQLAAEHATPILQPTSLRDAAVQQQLRELHADVLVVVAYGLILPKEVLEIPKYGCINVHASLLPRWRGAAPIVHALLAGDKITGVTIMQMDAGLDTGPMLAELSCPIADADTGKSLTARLADLGATALLATLEKVADGAVKPIKQDNSRSTYAGKISKIDARLDWQQPAEMLEQMVRAYNPWPVAYSHLDDLRLRIWQAQVSPIATNANPGTVIMADKQGIDVATAAGALRITALQLPGAKVLTAAQVLNAQQELFQSGKVLS